MGSDNTLIGSTFAGRFRISGLIGEGGMATVYRGEVIAAAPPGDGGDGATEARRTATPDAPVRPVPTPPPVGSSKDRQGPTAPSVTPPSEGSSADSIANEDSSATKDVAIKIMNAQLARDPTFVKRFQREAKAAARLKHRSTVRIHSWGVDDGLPYIVMELIDGAELVRIIHHEKRLPEARAARLVAQVCSALAAAHDLGIVHRDLKPENVMVMRDTKDPTQERVKVLDFGIAKTLEPELRPPDALPADSDDDPPSSRQALTMVGTMVGTPEYMSPEQARGIAVDTRSDIYACGTLLYQMVTGKVPFTGDTPFEIAVRHIEQEPAAPSTIVRGLHPRLEALILRALAKAPGDRPQSAREMQEELLDMLPELSHSTAQSLQPAAPPRPAAGRASKPDEGLPRLMTPIPDSDQALTRRWPLAADTVPRSPRAPPIPAAGAPAPRAPPILAGGLPAPGPTTTIRMSPEALAAARDPSAAGNRPAPPAAVPTPTAVRGDARLDPPTPMPAKRLARPGLSNAAALGLGVLLGGAIIAVLTLVLTLVR